ncbi:hypothetical protein [Cellulomonas wangsupingiae]|uniref:SipW-cognate class signal peptide n=1 Tax=Cellulomonas wangsupingiae TaxID=2968085 RepID=A0ABY5K3J2_9CELL|nr:hypothetical protein [Cellulomonas wangsupingiae]MCC2335473.1 hypothetical protein [Cellulomonas wangsupingiae]UUI64353.1 hypothetical protein NP075_14670 [Cellulomonas wangsupingiae]
MMDELLEDMIDPAPSRQDVARRRRAWATGSILVLAGVGVTSLTTSALFTDKDPLTGGISTGTVVLSTGGEDVRFDVPVEGLAPGGAVVAPVVVSNAGSLELRYAVSMAASRATAPNPLPAGVVQGDGLLHDQLRIRVFSGTPCTIEATGGDNPEGEPATGVAVLGDTADLVEGDYGLPTDMTPIVGDPQTGQDTDDRVLEGVTTQETLCVRADLSSAAGNTYQNTATSLTFQLDSEQTVNN